MSAEGGPPWDGRGLPPVAAERVRRAASGGPWTSLLSAPAAAGLAGTEFEPVGEVMGTIVQRIGWQGFRGCGGWGGTLGGWGASRVVPAYQPYVRALRHGYDTALHRLYTEAQALGADGIVGVALTVTRMDQGAREFCALGTAVRSRRGDRAGGLFSTDLPAQDVAKLAGSGWMPSRIVYGIAVALRHDDWSTRSQTGMFAGNTEVEGYTQLVTHVRVESRRHVRAQIVEARAHGAIVSSMGVSVWHVEPSEGHRDHVAEATVLGNALVGRGRPDPQARRPPLTFLPLNGGRA